MVRTLITIILSVVVTLGIIKMMPTASQETAKESVYDRVMRTGTIRCGYALYDPLLIKDPNSGKLHGVFYDLLTEIGQELDLKINWVAEVGYGEIEEGFLSNKYDVFCNGAVITPKRAKFAYYTMPIYYQATMAWVRADDSRFDASLERLNDPAIRVMVKDGDVSEMIAGKMFPEAKAVSVPQLVDYTQMLVDVQTGKADAAFLEKSYGDTFLKKNPGSIKIARLDDPVNVSAVGMLLPSGENKLKNAFDASLAKLLVNGEVDRAFRNNAPTYDLWAISRPYARH
ncbi:MAG: substrate-binding periplasmic protein [Bdellovibrionales bacterium]